MSLVHKQCGDAGVPSRSKLSGQTTSDVSRRTLVRLYRMGFHMTFNPLEQQGIPLDQQLRNWRELNVLPVDPDHSDPYTKCRIIAMNGIEVEAILFSHNFTRVCPDPDVKRKLAEVRYIEQQQQKVVNWLLPGSFSPLETTIS